MQTNNNTNNLGQGHGFQHYMMKIWMIMIGIALIAGILTPIFFLDWFYKGSFWNEYSLLIVMLKNGQWRYYNYLHTNNAVMLGFYFLIENIILFELLFIYIAYKVIKAEEKRHINIEAKYREKINSECRDKDFEKNKHRNDGMDKFKTE